MEVNSLRLTHGHIYSLWAPSLAAVYLCLGLMCALVLHLHKTIPMHTHTCTHTSMHSLIHTDSVDSRHRGLQLPLPESPHQMDESCHQSRAQEEFRQSAYSSEPNTRVQSPLPCLLNSLFCHFQSQFVTVTWLSSPVSCHRGVKKRSRGTTENMSVSVKCLCCNDKVLMGCLL